LSAAVVIVVVGVCIAVVASVMSSALEPATRSPAHARAEEQARRQRARRPASTRPREARRPTVVLEVPPGRPRGGAPVEPVRWRDRIRAAAALGALATALGIVLATAFGIAAVVLVALLRRSLG
jgi:hypothetical protein